MMNQELPRIVVVTRPTPLELLVQRCGTRGQAKFYLESRGEPFAPYKEADERFHKALDTVTSRVPEDMRMTRVVRSELDRFVFAPDDIVVLVGQDGLVANVAKYLNGQRVIGINSDPERFDGVLCGHDAADFEAILRACLDGRETTEERCMVVAEREDGQRLLALNEIFIGHRSHQSARYRLSARGDSERQSSSGIVVATGTGSTGWARSIARQRGITTLPRASEPRLAWFVREPFPSVSTATELDHGVISAGENLWVGSEMGEGGVIFADGIEHDWLEFVDGQSVRVQVARRRLSLVTGMSVKKRSERRREYPVPNMDWITELA